MAHLLEEGGLRWHLYEIESGNVEGAVAADTKIDTGRGDYLLGNGDDLAFGERRGITGKAFAKAFALCDVEDGEPFEEKMTRLASELSEMFKKSHELEDEIRKKLGAIGYEI